MFEKKRILVTGVCGTVGAELVRQLMKNPDYSPEEVIGIDNNESQLFFMDQDYLKNDRVRLYIADICDHDELVKRTRGIDVIFHAAALKHVILSERSPDQVVRTNVSGVQNIIAAATENNVEIVIFTSSDKAVNPTNVMGTSKLMGERLMTAANSHKRGNGPVFASTRFGNVLGSNGSVVPVFIKQIKAGGPVTLTDPAMTRFVMTVSDAVQLVIESANLAQGGEVFVTKMPVARIEDLAQVMISELAPKYGYDSSDIQIVTIGSKPGEKLYEELLNEEETRRTLELDKYFAILPAFSSVYEDIKYQFEGASGVIGIDQPYNSSLQGAMSQEKLRSYLIENQVFTGK